jgi:diguanylate cyclase (GGDEF)-like protein
MLDRLERALHGSRAAAIGLAVALSAIIFVLDLITEGELAFSHFYVVPVGVLVWFAGVRTATVGAVLGAGLGLFLDLHSEATFSHAVVPYWNALTSVALYIGTIVLLVALQSALAKEKELARTDGLTGVANSRRFYETAEMELSRSARYKHPFTMVYVDVDDLKMLNDRLGHVRADEILKAIADAIDTTARDSDLVARLGGDEFAVLLPETKAEGASGFLVRLKTHLMNVLEPFGEVVTVSIGAVTFLEAPDTVDEMVKAADDLMYEVKRAGKNDIRQRTVGGALELDETAVVSERSVL